MRKLTPDAFRRVEALALDGGAIRRGSGVIWNIAGRCSAPVMLSFTRARSVRSGVIDIVARCRRCAECLKTRARKWAARAGHEYLRAHVEGSPTWMGTLTFGAQARSFLFSAMLGTDNSEQRRRALLRKAGEEVTRYLKRLRKAGARIRYLLVVELHKDGMPHFHILLHGRVSWRSLAAPWHAGFSHFRLVQDAKGIRYATKYLAKDRLGRVRASRNYGISPQA